MFIPDPVSGFFSVADPDLGSRGQNSTGSATLVLLYIECIIMIKIKIDWQMFNLVF
jgi:hypothetical protein